jgi:four helix bundle protein
MYNYKNLFVWEKSMALVEKVYEVSNKFPEEEKYGLKSQMRLCALSIPNNIAEGSGRKSQKEFKLFLGLAKGSLNEMEIQLELSVRLGFLRPVRLQYHKNDVQSDKIYTIIN